MRDFGLIHTRYWTWAQEHGLSDSAKLIGAYLLTCEHGNSLGCFRCPKAYVAEDLGYSIDTVSKGYTILEFKGLIRYCEASKWILIPKFLHWNKIQNPKHASSVLKNVSQIPSSFQLTEILIDSLHNYGGKHLGEEAINTVYHTLSDTVCQTVSIQREGEGEGEGEGEKNTCARRTPTPPNGQLSREQQQRFDRFWSIYPKKRSKGQAVNAWKKIQPSEQLVEIMVSKIEQAKTSRDWIKEGGKFIPYPATWLNAEGWEDDYTPMAPMPYSEKTAQNIQSIQEWMNGDEKDPQ